MLILLFYLQIHFNINKIFIYFVCEQNQEADGMETEGDGEVEGATTLHALRLAILEKLVQHIPQLRNVGGVIAIPFMQVNYIDYFIVYSFVLFFSLQEATVKKLLLYALLGSTNVNIRFGR